MSVNDFLSVILFENEMGRMDDILDRKHIFNTSLSSNDSSLSKTQSALHDTFFNGFPACLHIATNLTIFCDIKTHQHENFSRLAISNIKFASSEKVQLDNIFGYFL